ncbi:putative membrane protein [Acinetobacter baumannii 1437282]|nr:putative membrane protein [Acinetobacter baumannii 1437282]
MVSLAKIVVDINIESMPIMMFFILETFLIHGYNLPNG